jgi:hypothetical protein
MRKKCEGLRHLSMVVSGDDGEQHHVATTGASNTFLARLLSNTTDVVNSGPGLHPCRHTTVLSWLLAQRRDTVERRRQLHQSRHGSG